MHSTLYTQTQIHTLQHFTAETWWPPLDTLYTWQTLAHWAHSVPSTHCLSSPRLTTFCDRGAATSGSSPRLVQIAHDLVFAPPFFLRPSRSWVSVLEATHHRLTPAIDNSIVSNSRVSICFLFHPSTRTTQQIKHLSPAHQWAASSRAGPHVDCWGATRHSSSVWYFHILRRIPGNQALFVRTAHPFYLFC